MNYLMKFLDRALRAIRHYFLRRELAELIKQIPPPQQFVWVSVGKGAIEVPLDSLRPNHFGGYLATSHTPVKRAAARVVVEGGSLPRIPQ